MRFLFSILIKNHVFIIFLFLFIFCVSLIFKINPVAQNKSKEIRYSRKNEFNEDIVREYLKKEINLNSKKFDNSLLKEPFFLNN